MTAKKWTNVAPEDMTLDQLAEASRHINAALSHHNESLTNLGVAAQRVQIQINQRFNVNLPNVQAPESLLPYPSTFLQNYEFPAEEEQV